MGPEVCFACARLSIARITLRAEPRPSRGIIIADNQIRVGVTLAAWHLTLIYLC